MKMFPMMATRGQPLRGLRAMAIAALVIGCDDDKADTADAPDTSEVADEVSEVSETTPETLSDTVSEIEPDTVSEIEPDTVSDIEPDTETPEPIELVGVWTSGFGDETITATHWNGFCVQAIARFDNDENVAILETVSGESCLLGFSRVVWNDIADDAFDYCTTTYAAATAEDAATAEVVNFSPDLTTGCGGFPWSRLTRK
jgi:hypothetical protein